MKQFIRTGIIAFGITAACSANKYVQHNLVSDIPGMADQLDPCLVNPWGIAASPTSPFWISDNGAGLSTIYNGNGNANSLIVAIPGAPGASSPGQLCGSASLGAGAPTGIIFNDTSSFMLGSAPASFIFATEQGVIIGWNGTAGKTGAIMADRSAAGAVYKGLATATRSEGPLLYAADFGNGTVDVFDGNMNRLSLPGAFVDPNIPPGFAPFNIQNLSGTLYVTYAKQNAEHHDDVAGPGNGYVDAYDLNGLLLQRLIAGGPLNSPWGVAVAPLSFGDFAGALLVGNFGDGAINAFDVVSGRYLGALQDGSGKPVHVTGLWGLSFGNGSAGGDADTLYFTAGIPGTDTIESHGLLGTIQPPPVLAPGGVVNAASFSTPIAPGAFTSIFGSSLAPTTRTWAAADFKNGKLPTQLDGVSVSIDGKPAYVSFISPRQIDVITPADSTTGPVQVMVTSNGVISAAVSAQMQPTSPAFFTVGKYVIAAHANGTLVGPPSLFPGASTPARPGETIVLYGTGFGPTNPVEDGLVVTSPAPIVTQPAIMIGNQTAAPTFVGLESAGLFQLNVTIPSQVAGSSGAVDLPVMATAGGASTQAGMFVTVQVGN